jgi:uncharacterized protein YqjF (DUF2071 family)
MSMVWRHLAFLHWPVKPAALRALVPGGLEIDTWEGDAWLGLVPFAMESVCPRFTPRIPPISDFPELNLRTYVTVGGKPGVYFFSLDATSPLAVRMARRFFHLPYFDARIECVPEGDSIAYRSERTHRDAPPALLRAEYRPTSPARESKPGSVEYWLTERYCLYAAGPQGAIFRGEIHHEPWPLQSAEAEIEENTVGNLIGLPLEGPPVFAHFASNLYVRAWLIEAV